MYTTKHLKLTKKFQCLITDSRSYSMKNVHSLYSVLTMKYKIWGYYINLMNFWFTFNMSAKTSELLFCIHTLVKSIVITMSIKFFNQSVIVIILIFLKLWDSLHDIPLWGPQDGKSTCWNSPHTGPWHPLSLWSCGLFQLFQCTKMKTIDVQNMT